MNHSKPINSGRINRHVLTGTLKKRKTPITLKFQSFRPKSPNYVFQHLRNHLHDPLLSQVVSDQILLKVQGRDLSQRSLFMIMFVKLTQKEYVVMASVSAAPLMVTESNCAICLKDMLINPRLNPYANCLTVSICFMRTEECVNMWLDRQQNSCPLCGQEVENLREV